jgi:glyoxylase I family protein
LFHIKSLDHIVLRVADVEGCRHFYEVVLGCTVEKIHTEIGLLQLRAGDMIIDLLDVDGPIGKQGGPAAEPMGHNVDHFCLRIEPFIETELRDHFDCHGVEAGPLLHNWGGDGRGPSMYVKDPAGNTVEIKGPPIHPYDPDVGYVTDSEIR